MPRIDLRVSRRAVDDLPDSDVADGLLARAWECGLVRAETGLTRLQQSTLTVKRFLLGLISGGMLPWCLTRDEEQWASVRRAAMEVGFPEVAQALTNAMALLPEGRLPDSADERLQVEFDPRHRIVQRGVNLLGRELLRLDEAGVWGKRLRRVAERNAREFYSD